MTHPAVERRVREQAEMIGVARGYVCRLRRRLSIDRAWVAGSVARGDFNAWSDIDLVLVARDLPSGPAQRHQLFHDRPAKIEVAAFTREEFDRAQNKKNALVLEALHAGVDVFS